MSRYIKGIAREQISMVTTSLDEMIPEESPARVIDALVESLDIEALGIKHAKPKKIGRKPYNPRYMLKLYIYGYFNGIRSTRKLERECKRNIELMWLLDNLKPDDKTISNFRKDNKKAIEGVFKQFSILCNELNLYGKELIAVDGSKFRANNSRKNNYTKNKVKKMIEHYEDTVASAEKYLELLESNDEKDKNYETVTHTKEEINKKIKKAKEINERIKKSKERIEGLKEMSEEIKKNGDISITDPDAKHMNVSNKGTDIAHNVQVAVDSKNHLVLAVDVVSTPSDQNQLYNMSSKAVEALGLKKDEPDELEDTEEEKYIITSLGDKGYYCGEELAKCKKDGIRTIVSKQKSGPKPGDVKFIKDNFKYDKEKDIYICPNGKILKNTSKENSKEYRYKNKEACENCKDKDKCTASKKGRVIRRGKYQEIYDEVDKRTKENKELYKQRQMIVEHPFGTIKRALGFTYFLTRGNESVKAESFLHFFTYNLIRVINIIGIKELTRILKDKKHRIFKAFCPFLKIKGKYIKFLPIKLY